MKKLLYFILSIILAFALYTCSTKKDELECFDPEYIDFDESLAEWGISFQNVCRCVTDAVKYPEPWNADVERNFVISDKTIRSMSTCGLWVSLQEERKIGAPKPWTMTVSIGPSNSVTYFNNYLRSNKMAVEFFNRHDFYAVLISKYISVIKVEGTYIDTTMIGKVYIPHLEMLLASDMSMSVLSDKEKIQLMAMALERTKYVVWTDNLTTCHIMIAIMKSYKYTPFMEDIEPWLVESNFGYTLSMPGEIPYNGFLSHHRDIIIEYANQFLNEQKIITL